MALFANAVENELLSESEPSRLIIALWASSADHLDHTHHSLILVIYSMAVIDETSNNYGVSKGND